ncbi:urea ABC transporter permease subunit UrtB [Thiohalomonas denitrificans]|uniref:urea ABC transporter permease subunit UrtB n=1 Tax=Thiohalomonas denitrificans TaxID=415747 RepID=UPI0026F18D1A|nr:urea ABC transporter permease subunit UrtB [Thiohalomonas denitrificans]
MIKRVFYLFATLLLLAGAPLPVSAADGFEQAIVQLTERSFRTKETAIVSIAESGDERALPLLKRLLDGDVRYLRYARTVVYAEKAEGGYRITEVLTGEELGIKDRREAKRVVINNALRSVLRRQIASLSLNSDAPALRLAAVREMSGGLDDETASALEARQQVESNATIREAIDTALALRDLESEDKALRLAAIERLHGSLEPVATLRLHDLAEGEASAEVKQAAQNALKAIAFNRDLSGFGETLFFGLSLGSVLVLAAIGLAITFGVMGVINMAHGELIMLGAYTTYVVQQLMPNHIGLSILVSIPAAFLISALAGIAIERGVIRHLYGRPLETLLATFGISLILQQTVRTIFSPLNRSVATPEFMSGALEINSALTLTYNRLYVFAFCLLVFAALLFILKKTPLGLQVRAVSQNRAMARAMGVRSEWVDALTFGLGSGVAGVAGVALSQLTNVGPNLGQAYIIDSFMVVVFGGVGNLWGTLVAGLSLGVANKVLEPWSGAVLAKILVLAFIILFIQKRPRGLFPQKGRAAEG